MKTLLLVRHAKSSWDNLTLSDFERPLNNRGNLDAPLMAKRIKDKKVEIECFVSSPAKRAKKTAKIFMEVYDKHKKNLVLLPSLYEASVMNFHTAVESMEDKYDNIAVFSHNPSITDFANSLTDYKVDNMPTCSVFGVKVQIEKWIDFKYAKKELLFFEFPKNSL
ncbi:MAG: phosphoglycerate mutase family protein [Ginsengibacter sp.]